MEVPFSQTHRDRTCVATAKRNSQRDAVRLCVLFDYVFVKRFQDPTPEPL